jgi:sulfite reductase (ferredoxin)
MPPKTWKAELAGLAPEAWESEIDVYETELVLKKRGKLEDRLFAETRLRRGAYGQRYDNGKRHDGVETRALAYPGGERFKGPETLWDAPGMQRIKLPFGGVTAEQLGVLAELAEEYSDRILHVTTRQDIQLHFVHIEDTPDLMRRLAAVGVTTREACGNSVRNVTACPIAGVCRDEPFDVSPYARALAFYLLGHEAGQDMGRKFKIAFSGCGEHACGLTGFHDIGCIARVRGTSPVERGFEFYVGGGLGPVPHAAELLDPFVPEAELLPLSEAVCRVFARLGERANRSRARMKFLLKKLGIDEFRRLVLAERAALTPDPRWTEFLTRLNEPTERPERAAEAATTDAASAGAGYTEWRRTNVYAQRQAGYFAATIKLPLGDFTPEQARAIVDLMQRYTGDTLRTTVEQNLLLRWIAEGDLPAVHRELAAAGLGEAGAAGLSDVTSCPGTDTCKLGISSSRGLAKELRRRLLATERELSPEAQKLHIKCSGCFNSCGQHHVADIGFLGVSRNVNGRRVPHFQLVVGGQWENNARTFGLAIGAVPSKNVPVVVERLTAAYSAERTQGESFEAWIQRIGRKQVKSLVADLVEVPSFEADPDFYRDWGDPRIYTTGDQGVGECAGEVVSPIDFALAACERQIFEAQVLLDDQKPVDAAQRARAAMTDAAYWLTRERAPELRSEPSEVLSQFRIHLADSGDFDAASVGGRFAHYLFRAHDLELASVTARSAHELIEEAQLFVDAAHQYHVRRVQPEPKPAE